MIGPWPEIVRKAKNGEIDGLLISGEPLARSIGLRTTNPIARAKLTVFARTNAPFEIKSLKDLAGKRVSIKKGVYMIDQALEPYLDEIEVIEASSTLEMLTLVLEGKADVAFRLHIDDYLIKQHLLFGIEPVYFDHEHITKSPASIRAEWPEFISIMNKALTRLGRARLNEINEKWITVEKEASPLVLTSEEKAWLSILSSGSTTNSTGRRSISTKMVSQKAFQSIT